MSSSDSEPNEVPNGAETPKVEPIRLPTIEEIRGQDIWNNCAIRSVVSGVMGNFCFPLVFNHLLEKSEFCTAVFDIQLEFCKMKIGRTLWLVLWD